VLIIDLRHFHPRFPPRPAISLSELADLLIQGLRPGVADGPVASGYADDLREYGRRNALRADGAQIHLVVVVQAVRAGADFGKPASCEVVQSRGGAPTADAADGEPGLAQSVRLGRQEIALRRHCPSAFLRGAGLIAPRPVCHDPHQRESGQVCHLFCQRDQPLLRDSAAARAAVEFDEHVDGHPRAGKRLAQPARHLDAVHSRRELRDSSRQRNQPRELQWPHDFIGDEDVFDARGSHHLGFTHLRRRHSDRPRADLHLRDLRRLVSLDVGSQFQASLVRDGLQASQVLLEDRPAHQQRRGVDVLQALAHQVRRHGAILPSIIAWRAARTGEATRPARLQSVP